MKAPIERQIMAGTYTKGESGIVMDTITIFKSQNGENVFIEMETEIGEKTVAQMAFSLKMDKFRELVKDVL